MNHSRFFIKLLLWLEWFSLAFHCVSSFICQPTRIRSWSMIASSCNQSFRMTNKAQNFIMWDDSKLSRLLSSADDSCDDVENIAPLSDDVIMIVDCSSILDINEAIASLRMYLRRYPFAAILPVQPLNYIPSETGVNVIFLRKKTQEKGSVDGGMVFDVVHDDSKLDDSSERCRFQLIGKRVTEGQSVSKIFSEKLVVTSLLKRLDGEQDDLGVRIESIFHRWL